MLSIGAMKAGQQSYYLHLAREDYSLHGGEPLGLWHGLGAKDLGLTGVVETEALTRLFEGFHPTEDRSLIQQQFSKDHPHQPGWDLTFSAPKSVSVLWSQADAATRKTLQAAHFEAVKAALNYLEEEVACLRKGRGGYQREPARLVVATFEHHTSRAQDPQLHTHALVMNVCTEKFGSTGTLESRSFYWAKMAAGALYRAEFAFQIERTLKLAVHRTGSVFEIAGVSEFLIREMSTRRKEVLAALDAGGWSGAKAAEKAAFSTRQDKEYVPQEQLTRTWHALGRQQKWGPEQAARLVETAQERTRDPDYSRLEALMMATRRSTEHKSYFSLREFTRFLAEEAQGRGIGAKELLAARKEFLTDSPEIVRLGWYKGELTFTTRTIMEEETRFFAAVEQCKTARLPALPVRTVEGVIATRRQMSDEQADALRHLTGEGASIRVVAGMAGTGKTTLLHAARMAWELEGYQVRGASLMGKAAEGLMQGTGIRSTTLKRTLLDVTQGHWCMTPKSVLVVDEAGVIGTDMMAELVEKIQRAGARLVLVGDSQQIQPVAAGAPFAEIQRRLGAFRMVEIKRQREEWAREAVKDFAQGNTESGLQAFAERGLLTIKATRQQAMHALITAWSKNGASAPEQQLILAGTLAEAATLNRMAQEERKKAGRLYGNSILIPESEDRLYEGDRILFNRRSRLHHVFRGSMGQVMDIDPTKRMLTVRLDNDEQIQFTLGEYRDVSPGYAMTTHKGQGATTERCYILAGGGMQDRELTTVQISRARAQTHIFVDRVEAGDDLAVLTQQMNTSRRKEMAHTIERAAIQEFTTPYYPR